MAKQIVTAGTVDQYQRARDVWRDYNSRQEFEHTLIDRKSTWLLTTQSILLAAFGFTFQASASQTEHVDFFRYALGGAALFSAVTVWWGVHALIRSKRLSWEQYKCYYEKSDNEELPEPLRGKPLPWGVDTTNTQLTLLPDRLQPFIFSVAWVALIVWTALD